MQSALKELRTLKQEEMTLINLASKISDQLNRLKVEELALQNLVRLQNEEQEGQGAQGTDHYFDTREGVDRGSEGEEKEGEVELDLEVVNPGRHRGWDEGEEEEEEEEMQTMPNDIEEFVKQLS